MACGGRVTGCGGVGRRCRVARRRMTSRRGMARRVRMAGCIRMRRPSSGMTGRRRFRGRCMGRGCAGFVLIREAYGWRRDKKSEKK
jgi:hypothetical protein